MGSSRAGRWKKRRVSTWRRSNQMTISADRCSEIIRAFDGQGWHRTATPGDDASTEWLIAELAACGADARSEAFPFVRVDADECVVKVGDDRFEAVPLSDSGLPEGRFALEGRISEKPGAGGIAVSHANHQGEDREFDDLRQGAWQAVIAAVGDPAHGVALRNALRYDAPSGAPVFQLPATALPLLIAARDAGLDARVEGRITRTETMATNVAGRVRGADSRKQPLVVLTPKSGWWHCAGERGGGLAIFLELAREIGSHPLGRDVVFVATTGHELGFIGAQRFLRAHPELAALALAWLHLGANIGAAGTRTVIRSSEGDLDAVVREAVAATGRPDATLQVTPNAPHGEAAIVAQHGGRYVSVVGGPFALFHSIDDRWPVAIDAEAIAANATLMLELLRGLDAAGSRAGV
jgi:hypothetical protein